jgi:hypothetical protein
VRNNQGDLIQLSSVIGYQTGAAPNTIERDRLRPRDHSRAGWGGVGVHQQVEAALARTCRPVSHAWSGNHEISAGPGSVLVDSRPGHRGRVHGARLAVQPAPSFTVMLALPLAFVGGFGLIWLVGVSAAGVIPGAAAN